MYESLALPSYTSGVDIQRVGLMGGDRIKMMSNHSGFLVSNQRPYPVILKRKRDLLEES